MAKTFLRNGEKLFFSMYIGSIAVALFSGCNFDYGNMALRFRARSLINMVWVHIQPWSCCCALGKGTLRYFPLLGGLTSSSKLQSYSISIKKKINRTIISRYLRKQVGVIAVLCIAPLSLSCESGG